MDDWKIVVIDRGGDEVVFRMNGELFKRLIALDHGAWVILL
ncbi:MAG: hypothetical protein ACLTCQ_23515 [Enterocloster bolteae]